jgi:hypothetical protein
MRVNGAPILRARTGTSAIGSPGKWCSEDRALSHKISENLEAWVGGFGSGRYGFSSAGMCESRHSIDLTWLRRRGIMKKGSIGGRTTLTWSRGGDKSSSIRVFAQADGLRLMYGVMAHDGTRISVDELVPLCLHGDQVRRPAASICFGWWKLGDELVGPVLKQQRTNGLTLTLSEKAPTTAHPRPA